MTHMSLITSISEGREGGDVAVVLQLSLHMTPTILDRIEVRGIAWPIQNVELLLELLQVVHHLLALVARCSVLQEELALVEPHERDQVIIQDFVAFPVHCTVLGEEVQTSSPLLATEASPHHDGGGMLDGGDGVAACSGSCWMVSRLLCAWG